MSVGSGNVNVTVSPGRSAASMMLGMAVGQVLTAVLFLFAARHGGRHVFGAAVVVISLGTLSQAFVDLGLIPYCTQELARGRMSVEEISERMQGKLLVVAVVGVIGAYLAHLLHGDILWWALPVVALGLGSSQASQAVLRGQGLMGRAGTVLALERITMAVLFVAYGTVSVAPASALPWSLGFGCFVAAVIGRWLAPPGKRLRPVANIQNPWRGSRAYGVFMTAVTLQTLDLPLLSLVSGSGAAGAYGAVNRWVSPLALLSNAVSASAVTSFARARDIRGAIRGLGWAAVMLLVALGVSLGVAAWAGPIVRLLLGREYRDSADALTFLAAGVALSIVNQPLAGLLMFGKAAPIVGYGMLGCILLEMSVVLFLGGEAGAKAAGIGFFAAQLSFLCLLTFILWRSRGKVVTE